MSALWAVMAVTGFIWWALFISAAAVLAVTQVTGRRRPRKRPQVGDDAIAMIRATRAPARLLPAPAEDIDALVNQWAKEGYGK